ncbi:5-oxoprolinase subunit PxpA [uncultured Tenacibaculum sp.]|uniref:5-oxoprolinase subunit PxpA n=1 Tax=uncultured Tenacibaculum sp. TaxID=174713 RepID=UPI00260E7705|nr:5-oxoprolinase subunit PxpA [uncultured Tenacibaculum sp.]
MYFKNVDINSDVGEGVNNEAILMPLISSCNIACNAHAGSVEIIDKVIDLAVQHNVKIGAHPSFPDRENFGRKVIEISNEELEQSLKDQIQLLIDRSTNQNAKIHHVKPHGALYNIAAIDKNYATIVLNAIEETITDAYLYAPYNSVIETLARERNIKVKFEAFVDRTYNNDLSLVSRSSPKALITDKEEAWQQLKEMVQHQKVKTLHNNIITIEADTFCVHGDNAHAIDMLKYINLKLNEFNK